MAQMTVKNLLGGFGFDPDQVFWDALYAGSFGPLKAKSITLVDAKGNKIVFKGEFNGGDGIITAFDVYMGETKVQVGSNLSIQLSDLQDAIALAFDPTWDPESLNNLLYGKRTVIGTGDDDVLYGAFVRGKVLGGGGNDVIFGLSGNETLKGQGGNDLIYGGAGKDKLFGGPGKDIFAFSFEIDEVDVIKDFEVKKDKIMLDSEAFGALTRGILPKSEFVVGKNAKTADHHVIYNKKKGILSYDENGSAPGGKVAVAKLDAGLDLTASHIIVGEVPFLFA